AFLKSEFAEAKQLFVFTHSFVFFKLVRDWLKGKNKKGKNGEPDKIKSCFYAIEITPGDERKARLANALASLIDYDSEYHYLFQKLYSFREKIQLDLNEAFLVGNIARKLLEAFFAFKFPRRRGNFSQWMEAGVADVEKRERVYRFINKYSHNQTIEAGDSSIDNLLGESTNIVGEILSILENLDANHYTELVEIASS
ncbi:MAG: AAA family ATPase, partial [Proteobacteria bacterium]|nr:AAA family ATPase [Pseudomonadota bacterium]